MWQRRKVHTAQEWTDIKDNYYQSFDHGGGQYMGKKIKRIFVSICIVTGIALLAVPFYYHFHGQNETDKLIEQFEKTLEDNEDETEESSFS